MLKRSPFVALGARALPLATCLALGMAAYGQGPQGPPFGPDGPPAGRQPGPPMQGMGPMAPIGQVVRPQAPSAMTTAGDYIYVLRGNVLLQLSEKGLNVLHRVTIEPEGRPGQMPGVPGLPDGRGWRQRSPGPGGPQAPGAPGAGVPGAELPGVTGAGPGAQPEDDIAPGVPIGQGPGPFGPRAGGPPPRGQVGPGMPTGPMPQMPGMGGPGPLGMFGPAPTLTANSQYVYVLRGPFLYQFSARDLSMVKRVALVDGPGDGPAAPRAGRRDGGRGPLRGGGPDER